MGCFAAALPHLFPGLLLVGQQRHLRQKLVGGAPQTVAVAPDESVCETTVRRSKRDGLGEWGGCWGSG
eukprot:5081534-Prymnesium_polylepis.1